MTCSSMGRFMAPYLLGNMQTPPTDHCVTPHVGRPRPQMITFSHPKSAGSSGVGSIGSTSTLPTCSTSYQYISMKKLNCAPTSGSVIAEALLRRVRLRSLGLAWGLSLRAADPQVAISYKRTGRGPPRPDNPTNGNRE